MIASAKAHTCYPILRSEDPERHWDMNRRTVSRIKYRELPGHLPTSIGSGASPLSRMRERALNASTSDLRASLPGSLCLRVLRPFPGSLIKRMYEVGLRSMYVQYEVRKDMHNYIGEQKHDTHLRKPQQKEKFGCSLGAGTPQIFRRSAPTHYLWPFRPESIEELKTGFSYLTIL
jgi:hypothetical protein